MEGNGEGEVKELRGEKQMGDRKEEERAEGIGIENRRGKTERDREKQRESERRSVPRKREHKREEERESARERTKRTRNEKEKDIQESRESKIQQRKRRTGNRRETGWVQRKTGPRLRGSEREKLDDRKERRRCY